MGRDNPREVELKLDVGPEMIGSVRALLEARLGPPVSVEQLESTYYDTADHELRRVGLSLRVRRSGGRLVQTLKRRRDRGPVFDRDEWEVPLASAAFDIHAFAHRSPATTLLEGYVVAPVFSTTIERRSWRVAADGATVELALDHGHVVAGHCREPLAELELELLEGEAKALFAFGERMPELTHLRLGLDAKSERGYRLASGAARAVTRAERPSLDKHSDAATAFRIIVWGCLHHLGANVPLIVEGQDPEAVHQARVALRRLRSALSLFRPLVADAQFVPLRAALQDLARTLGGARDLDVCLADLSMHGSQIPGALADRVEVLAALERLRADRYAEVVARLGSADFNRLVFDLARWCEAGPWTQAADRDERRREPVRASAARVLQARLKRLRRQGRHLARLEPDARHRVRIEAKKLRYACGFFGELARRRKALKRLKRLTEAVGALQEALGALNDRETRRTTLHELGPSGARLAAAMDLDGDAPAEVRADPLDAARLAQARVAAAKPFWSAWRP